MKKIKDEVYCTFPIGVFVQTSEKIKKQLQEGKEIEDILEELPTELDKKIYISSLKLIDILGDKSNNKTFPVSCLNITVYASPIDKRTGEQFITRVLYN